jgi:hypothetical protein
MRLKNIILVLFALFVFHIGSAQTSDDLLRLLINKGFLNQKEVDSIRAASVLTKKPIENSKNFTLDLQIKNRLEYRDGYGTIPDLNTNPAAFVNQRSRLNFNYQDAEKLNAVLSIQDTRIWGSKDPRGLNGTIQLFEGYIEPYLTKNLSVRVGRQRIIYDNQRLFAENEWRVNAAAHDAINFRYQSPTFTTELVVGFNQTNERLFGTDFTPTELSNVPSSSTATNWTNYKALAIHYLKYKFNKNTIVTTITAADAYQDASIKEQNYWRLTYGGRLEYVTNHWYATVSGYIQSGRNNSGKTIKAWYVQPEIKYTAPNQYIFRLGAEIFSGNNGTVGDIDHNFVPLYGVAHRFNGSLDFFTRFPSDLNNAGLVNPYFFITKSIGKKVEISSNNHLFYTLQNFITSTNSKLTKFMGYEHDLLVTYKPNTYTAIEGGFSVAVPTNTLTAIKKSGDANQIANWAYIQVKFTPTLFKNSF